MLPGPCPLPDHQALPLHLARVPRGAIILVPWAEGMGRSAAEPCLCARESSGCSFMHRVVVCFGAVVCADVGFIVQRGKCVGQDPRALAGRVGCIYDDGCGVGLRTSAILLTRGPGGNPGIAGSLSPLRERRSTLGLRELH